uniref:Truncated envelope glycoprotein n=1 Tax=Human immunodeficiency virus type 1 TaxID=11676 RepID=A0A0H3YCW6_HV1|nr:truncated envelope glycoprotein [Human immunodeficiency virus 1]
MRVMRTLKNWQQWWT